MLTDKQARATGMAQAFFAAAQAAPKSKVTRRVDRAVQRNAGLVQERAINANLSYRTAQKLKQQEII